MKTTRSFVQVFLAAAILFSLAQAGAAEEGKPEFKDATYFGGTGAQGGFSQGMGFATDGEYLYLSGFERTSTGNDQTLGLKYSLPPGPTPVWSLRWPNVPSLQRSHPLYGVAVTEEGVYFAGEAKADEVNRYGVWATRSVLVKYPLGGPTGPETGGALLVSRPFFFPSYNGNEGLRDILAVKEGGSTFLYATGLAEAGPDENVAAILAKFDTKGTLLWWKALGETRSRRISHGLRLTALNGAIYVAGAINPDTLYDWGNWRAHIKSALWKVDPSGNVIWMRTSSPAILSMLEGEDVVGLGDYLYVAATLRSGADGKPDVLLLKYDENGNLLWSKEWGSLKEEVARGIAASGNRVYVVGESRRGEADQRGVFLVEVNAENGNVLSVDFRGIIQDDRAFNVLVVGGDLYVVGDSYASVNGTLDVMLLRYTLSAPVPDLNVSIDIRPESFPNPVNPKSQGNIPVAILSTAAFDAPALVDRATLTFGRTGLEKSLLSIKRCVKEDVNGDGLWDLLCHFDTQSCAFQPGDTRGLLMGKTLKGRPLVGSDSVVIVPHKKDGEGEEEKWKQMKPPPSPAPGKSKTAPKESAPPAKPPTSEADGLKRGEIGY